LAKGGKWIFGWVVVGPNCEIPIPPDAFIEYGFQPGEAVFFIRGSRVSGGFSLGRFEKLAQSKTHLKLRGLGQGRIDLGRYVVHPPDIGINSGDRLLVGRGSGLALGLLQRGPIHEEAVNHPGIETFTL
jgi:hypothetical protein